MDDELDKDTGVVERVQEANGRAGDGEKILQPRAITGPARAYMPGSTRHRCVFRDDVRKSGFFKPKSGV